MNNKNNEQNKIIVNNIRTLAATRGTNIATIERELGIGNGTIGKWAKAAKSPPYETLYKIATHFGVTVAELTGEADENGIKNSPSTDHSAEAALDEELIRRLLLLTPEEAAKVDAFVQGILAAR